MCCQHERRGAEKQVGQEFGIMSNPGSLLAALVQVVLVSTAEVTPRLLGVTETVRRTTGQNLFAFFSFSLKTIFYRLDRQ